MNLNSVDTIEAYLSILVNSSKKLNEKQTKDCIKTLAQSIHFEYENIKDKAIMQQKVK